MKVQDLTKNIDERGFFAELKRADLEVPHSPDEALSDVMQINLSYSYPGIVRAWHRHPKGQMDNFICLQGSIKVAEMEDLGPNVEGTRYKIKEVVLSEQRLQVATVNGTLWHGFEVIGDKPALIVYFVDHIYDPENEERKPWDEPNIWNRVSNK